MIFVSFIRKDMIDKNINESINMIQNLMILLLLYLIILNNIFKILLVVIIISYLK